MLQVKQFAFNHLQTNCYVIWCDETLQCAIVDPSMEAGYEDAQVDQFIAQQGLTPTLLLLTHAHPDHIAGLPHVVEQYKLQVHTHRDSLRQLRLAGSFGSVLGFDIPAMENLGCLLLDDKQVLALGNDSIETRYLPGHCPGSFAYVLHNEQMVLTGDALFRFSIGRTDLPGGDYQQLVSYLQQQVFSLPDDYVILPGHGDCSRVGDERIHNPFLV